MEISVSGKRYQLSKDTEHKISFVNKKSKIRLHISRAILDKSFIVLVELILSDKSFSQITIADADNGSMVYTKTLFIENYAEGSILSGTMKIYSEPDYNAHIKFEFLPEENTTT